MAFEVINAYTEIDSLGKISFPTSTSVFLDDVERNGDEAVYKDFGANFWDGDFRHWFDFISVGTEDEALGYPWLMANVVDHFDQIYNPSGNVIYARLRHLTAGPSVEVFLQERVSGVHNTDTLSPDLSVNTQYYGEVERDEAIGTFGTLYFRIYSDASHSTLIDTLVVTLGALVDWRYFYVVNAYNGGGVGAGFTGTFKNYDLDPPEAPTFIPKTIFF